MFRTEESSKGSFLQQTKAAREERANEKRREAAITYIQANVRGWLARIRFTKTILEDYDTILTEELNTEGTVQLKPALQVYKLISKFLLIYKKERDEKRLERLCRYLVQTLDSESLKLSYVGVALNKDYSISWISQMKSVLHHCLSGLEDLRPDRLSDHKSILLRLHTLVSFTSAGTWAILRVKNMEKFRNGMNQLCANIMGHLVNCGFYAVMKVLLVRGLGRATIALKPVALSAAVTLSLRPLISSQMSDKLVSMFLINVCSVPALIHHLNVMSPECISALTSHNLFTRSLELLNSEQNLRIVFNALEGNYALCLLANLIQLANIERDEVLKDLYFPSFTFVVTRMLEACQQYVVAKQSNLTYWHPVLGCFAQSVDTTLQQAIPHVKLQLACLWNGKIVSQLIGSPLSELVEKEMQYQPDQQSTSIGTNIFRRAFLEARTNRNNSNKNYRKLGSPEATRIALICSLYQTALHTLTQMKLDILTGLCYQDKFLYHMWLFLCTLGPYCGLKAFLDHLAANTKCTAPEFQMLILFADCMTHYVTILDDMEMYEQQFPFKLSDFITMSYFLNQFLYKAVLNNLFDVKTVSSNPLFTSLHTLLMALYRRDCRRTFCPDGHWLAKEVRVSGFLADLEKGRRGAALLLSKMPHVIPHSERVVLFRKHVSDEKAVLGLTVSACNSPPSTLIAVHRSRIVEDGYRQLAMLPSQALKGVIRVRFVNEQGLDEAGIDQDGVFKEFLEETIKRVFDPSLNLFRATTENRLYPSPTSSMQENHLQLFEFVGRMLGKAVYEGIVVDVPFASFFVSQFSGQAGGALYSWLDELASLDRDLYRSLTLVKHFKGDVRQLELTFSLDEDVLGKLVTHELVPGGRAVPVTNQSKINYIHLMAHFRMHTQIKDQTSAFIKGFRSIINPDWLSLFSTPELQRLISGDNVPLDLKDLRRHTQYYGGFHDSHRVVCWLWDILEKDFSEEERGLFLKFVTSCSKSPLLGFAHLEPPFSIRCVEVGDDEDTGDTIGSVIRGFFTIRKKDPQNRLPTSSTCFNLLKLPNYQKKSTLREKLRYAVTSNTGFELS
ncbi:ubiquitin-protein ligase E3B [Neodiprion pinetum]|uniref:ubiquitin-protein ligase E3B n=1 Tax=Neodiprion fabricii TaxID=2872261 RepID=UPI001ED8D160|nr:ubiquitin-protein ligase E3B [Neodiprion fabricii]XP_046427764.1 ubiquitin-protein ligase E3B [Neodiprion fabricii]XP_046484535.1 ubiquitin-protein ligase E3B [Neodiprion pinetum]XP_046619370.1 ubiquitin-protein ligase E3B [Neodiprion virginianus]XP_046619371.1 ubiquitin-protein ligase E3B [Neodiprion virginianus]